ncbi:ATP-binding protein [Pseudidiomarina sp. CB1]|uniref:ATP-binding protein n=1 Tax=Pseudidiomarina sp. CB1 TaxID=2972484 RepID=UPI00216158AD|nr:ATP-binding protein [Pseudidiomarina sp. CB1]
MKSLSLRRQLLLSTNIVVIAVLILGAWLNYRITLHELDEVFDAEMAQTTRVLKSLIHDPGFLDRFGQPRIIELPPLPSTYAEEGDERQSDGHPYERKLAFQVWGVDGKLLLASENALGEPLSNPLPGYHELQRGDFKWIGFSYFDEHTQTWIYTAQREDVRSELSTYITTNQRWIVLLTWLPLSLAILLSIVWFMRPVRLFAQQLQQRDARDFSPVQARLPSELRPIQANINLLLARIHTYLEREKNFIADASHELRTPLAALRLHADQIDPNDPQSIAAVQHATERLTHLVNQLLLLTKLEGTQLSHDQLATVSLETIVHEALAELPEPLSAHCEWRLNLAQTPAILGLPTLLTVMVRNLLQNASKYAADNGVVEINTQQLANGVELVICDNGPGVPVADLQRLGERFFRHPETRHLEGAGLGLSIVKRIADLHTIQVTFESPPKQGLRVRLLFTLVEEN